jgi:DNA-binding transcriptional LysR family regulator
MDVRLKHVVALARCGSFTAAGRSIGVTQSSVTRAIADIEREIGYSLFHRTTRGTLLTERGRIFADRAARLLEDERDLLKRDTEGSDPFKGALRIGVAPAMMESLVGRPVAVLKERHPKLQLEIISSPFDRVAPMLHAGIVDVLLCVDDALRKWPQFRRHPLWELKTTAFVRNGHPLLSGEITEEKVAQYEIISTSDSEPYSGEIRALYEKFGIDWRERIHHIDFYPNVRKVVERSDALGTVIISEAEKRAFQARFTLLPRMECFSKINICCATRERWEDGPILRTFIDIMRDQAHPVYRPTIS